VIGTLVGLTAAASVIGVGGGLYEFSAVDPYWPKRFDIVQPTKGGINRKFFWIPSHTVFELLLIASLVFTWSLPEVRFWLLLGFASHAAMRIWSAFDFIPKALAFEKAEQTETTMASARGWTMRSRFRFPLDIITSGSVLAAFWKLAQVSA
jgi:hypothetical protein